MVVVVVVLGATSALVDASYFVGVARAVLPPDLCTFPYVVDSGALSETAD